MIIPISRCNDIMTAVEQMGGVVPPELFATVDALDQVRSALASANPAEIVLSALDKGKPITTSVAVQAAQAQATRDSARETERWVENALAARFREQITGPAGAALLDSLRPQFDLAAAAMTELKYPVGATADQLIDMGPKAIESWKSIRPHREFLDRLVATVLLPLHQDLGVPGADGRTLGGPWYPLITACWLSTGPVTTNSQLEPFRPAAGQTTDPAGRWHTLAGALALNGPTRTQELLDQSLPHFSSGIQPMPPINPHNWDDDAA